MTHTPKRIYTQVKTTGLCVCLVSLPLGIYEKKQLLNLSSEKLLPFTLPSFPSTNHLELVSTTTAKREKINNLIYFFFLNV